MSKGRINEMKKRKLSIIPTLSITVFIVLFFLTSCTGGIPGMGGAFGNTSGATQVETDTYQVVRGNISQEISVTGSIDSNDYTTYNLQVSGEVLSALEVGDIFKKGDLLMEIDDQEKQDSLYEIEKNLEISESSLKLAQLSYQSALDSNHIAIQQAGINEQKAAESTENAMESLKISMESANASIDSSERALEEAEELLEIAQNDSTSTNAELAQAESSVESAEEKLDSAELSKRSTELQSESSYEQALTSQSSTYWSNLSSLQSAEKGIAQAAENLKQTEIKLELARVEYENAKEDLGEYTVYAPYDGIVLSSDFTVGGDANGSGGISIISNSYIIDCMISESDITRVSVGQAANIDFDAYPGIEFSGEVKKIIPLYTESNNIVYYEVLVSFNNTEGIEILYGFSANISIMDLKAEDVLLVPIQAVYKEDGKSYVDVIIPGQAGESGEGQSFKKTEITTGANDYYNIEIVSGLNEGDIIATSR